MSKQQLQFHPASDFLPLMQGQEYRELLKDIQDHGQREPLLLHPDGRILDGRNRYRVCRELGIKPKVRKWEGNGDSPLSVVLSLNLHRRHLTSSQKAAIAIEILPELEAEAKERQRQAGKYHGRGKVQQKTSEPISQPQAAEQLAQRYSTNSDYVKAAKKIKEADPELLQKVRDGKFHIADALKRVVQGKREKRKQLPTPKEARRIAIAENRTVAARDGYYYMPKTEEQEAKEVEQGRREGKFFDAINALNSMPFPADRFASEIPEYRRFRVDKDLNGAIKYLNRFKEVWK